MCLCLMKVCEHVCLFANMCTCQHVLSVYSVCKRRATGTVRSLMTHATSIHCHGASWPLHSSLSSYSLDPPCVIVFEVLLWFVLT